MENITHKVGTKRNIHFENRDTWLQALDGHLAKLFQAHGVKRIPRARMSTGFTSHGNKKGGQVLAQAWSDKVSKDGTFEIFIDPMSDNDLEVAASLAHERIHTILGISEGHGQNFANLAVAIGLRLPATSTTPGDSFQAWFNMVKKEIGRYPHASLEYGATPLFYKKQKTPPFLSVRCPTCDYYAKIPVYHHENDPALQCPHDHGPLLTKTERKQLEMGV